MGRLFVLISFLTWSSVFFAAAQIELEYLHPSVLKNSDELLHAFSTGLNSPQFQEIDLDNDGDFDLAVFERSSDMIICFENTGSSYELNEWFSTLFPDNIQHWMVLADYNCDGRNDLFTYSNSGVRVFANVISSGNITWELVAEPLLTEGINGPVNVLFNATDIPSISDQDGDGDLDFLFFNFTNGDQIEYHKNYAVEILGTCGLQLVKESTQYGQIDVCECDEFEFQGESCHSGSKILHVAGKAILSYDQTGNGAMDLIISQEECPNLSFLPNAGTSLVPNFQTFDNTFPSFDSPINLPSFPASYFLDVTFDGQKDVLVAQNVRDNHHNAVDFRRSSILFENQGDNQFLSPDIFLQDHMIDIGAHAYPSFADINGDGLEDLVISNEEGNLTCYFQTTEGFEFHTNDLFNFSSLGFVELKIQFVELNHDGKIDLAIGVHTHMGHVNFFYHFINKSEGLGIEIDINDPQSFDFTLDRSDDFFLHDMDSDGLIDLLVANVFGELNHYKNTGSDFTFVLERSNILESEANAENSNLSISVEDIDEDGDADLITTRRNGDISIYLDFPNNTSASSSFLVKFEGQDGISSTNFGRKSKPTIGRFNNKTTLAIGTLQGGISLLSISSNSENDGLKMDAFPNPSADNVMTFRLSEGAGYLEIVDLSGKSVSIKSDISSESPITLDLSYLKPGMYIVKMETSAGLISRRIKIISD